MGFGGESSFSFIHTQVAMAVWGFAGWLWRREGGEKEEGKGRPTPVSCTGFRPSPCALALWPRPLTAI